MKRASAIGCLALSLALLPAHAEEKPKPKAWTNPETAAAEDPDFLIQGEYGSAGKATAGVQVVALGGGNFHAHIIRDGLPGVADSLGKDRALMEGKRDGENIGFASGDGKTSGVITDGEFLLTIDGVAETLPKISRESPTLGAKPPRRAVVLFDGTHADEWENGEVIDGHLQATNATSKRLFGDYSLHLEFRTPYMPSARGQQRGNSGIYHGGRWETQILDSFGLAGRDNEAGGIYSVAKPRLNMCLPPLVWQTYDVDFTAAKFDAEGNRTAWPRITVKLNGVTVHEDLELAKDFTASAPITQPLTSPEGPVFLQNHKDPVEFRNIWIVPGK